MNMQEVLTYQLGPLPWSLATADGAPTKTAKSALLHILEGKAQPVEDVPASAVWILDGVAIICIAFHERCPKDIQLSSQLCLPGREIGGVPG